MPSLKKNITGNIKGLELIFWQELSNCIEPILINLNKTNTITYFISHEGSYEHEFTLNHYWKRLDSENLKIFPQNKEKEIKEGFQIDTNYLPKLTMHKCCAN